MQRLRKFFCITLVILCVYIFGLSVNAAEIEYIQGIQERGYIKVGIPPYKTPPFYYIDQDTNQLSWYLVEIANDFASILAVILPFVLKL